jgi:hypothetical protein
MRRAPASRPRESVDGLGTTTRRLYASTLYVSVDGLLSAMRRQYATLCGLFERRALQSDNDAHPRRIYANPWTAWAPQHDASTHRRYQVRGRVSSPQRDAGTRAGSPL